MRHIFFSVSERLFFSVLSVLFIFNLSAQDVPREVSSWIQDELAQSRRKTLMDFDSGEFFAKDSARLIGYIKGYNPDLGIFTGIIYADNVITHEDSPIAIQIYEDGRFEGIIPMNYPSNLKIYFEDYGIDFYIQPGQTLSMILNWEEFLKAYQKQDRLYIFKDIQFLGATADINTELTAFHSKLPVLPENEIYTGLYDKEPEVFKVFHDTMMAGYTKAYQNLLETENLSKQTKVILQNNYKIMYASHLFLYESKNRKELPIEFYDFLQDIPMNDRELFSTSSFRVFINCLEFCFPFKASEEVLYKSMLPKKRFSEYLFEELGLQKTPEDLLFISMQDSMNIKANLPEMTEEKLQKIAADFNYASQAMVSRHGENLMQDYKAKYLSGVRWLTRKEIAIKQREIKDSIYLNELKLNLGIVYDVTKVRELDFLFGQMMKDEKEDARLYLDGLKNNIQEPFFKEEAERIFQKNYPVEKQSAYELPDTKEANFFKEIIAPFKGKILFIDFWGTTCGPCIAGIKRHKEMREMYKNSEDVAFIFITSESESPGLAAYNKFVEEQGLIHTFRLNMNDYRFLRQLFKFNSIPKYIIVDRDSRILNDDADLNHFGQELEKYLKN
jgi:thiol-disulfide isomerase/thioredoxin